jgi:hypothetical protein
LPAWPPIAWGATLTVEGAFDTSESESVIAATLLIYQ